MDTDHRVRPWDEELTPREQRSLELASHGVKIRDQAVLFGVSYEAAKDYRRQALRKLRCHSTAEAVAVAIRRGLIV